MQDPVKWNRSVMVMNLAELAIYIINTQLIVGLYMDYWNDL